MTNEQLATLIQQGDAEELKPILWERVRKLMYMKSDKVYRVYRDRCDSAGVDAWDIKQACYDAFLKAVAAYKPDSGYLLTTFLQYPFRTAVQSLLGTRTKKQDPLNNCASLDKPIENGDGDTTTMLELLPDTASAGAFLAIEEQDEAACVRAAVERLSDPRQREVIQQYYFEGKEQKAIGEALGVSAERVRQIKVRAFRELRKDSLLRLLWQEHKRHSRWTELHSLRFRPEYFEMMQELQERPDWQALSYGKQKAEIHSGSMKILEADRKRQQEERERRAAQPTGIAWLDMCLGYSDGGAGR